ncbi:hypothetical protein LU298_10150 [Komagataeibacter intermedius]|uniref:hypothetical protein n=1 Tax=Komagataeibacter intermedius TaxID=66229 RepID=UPI0018FE92EC|nr:hypothetical protein [Komagataeibacter intermedius]MCF3636855.1 hypothetical protein [Komagataeibacter intermedius]
MAVSSASAATGQTERWDGILRVIMPQDRACLRMEDNQITLNNDMKLIYLTLFGK